MLPILSLLILFAVVYRAMTPEARAGLAANAVEVAQLLKRVANSTPPECEQFNAALRARASRAFVTHGVMALSMATFIMMVLGPGTLTDPETLVRAGGNFGPRTTNGEWWRLASSIVLHASLFQLIVNLATLLQVGNLLERLVGRVVFTATLVIAGAFASLVSLFVRPGTVSGGLSGAVFGVYGLLLVTIISGRRHPTEVTIPFRTLRRLVPTFVIFTLYNMNNDALMTVAELVAFAAGVVVGIVLANDATERPSVRRLAATVGSALIVVAGCTFPLRGMTDARPEVERVVAVEDRTAQTYRTAMEGLKKGRSGSETLIRVIDETILPELKAIDDRVKALRKVPEEQQPLVASAVEFLRLRSESWRLRADGLRRVNKFTARADTKAEQAGDDSTRRLVAEARYRSDMRTLAQAEAAERASLEILRNIRTDQKTDDPKKAAGHQSGSH